MTTVPGSPAGDSGPERPESGWSAARAHLDPEDPHLLDRLGLVVPDDARALEADRRELLGLRPYRRHRHPQLAALLVTFCMLGATVALTGSLLTVMTPDTGSTVRGGYALAERTTSAPGTVGGLVPDAGATHENGDGVSARDLRPAVFVVPPALAGASCATCADAMEALQLQAHEYGIPVYLVAPPDGADAARALLEKARAGTTNLLVDPSGALTAAFAGSSPQAVLVHADGVVGRILRDPAPAGRFEQFLSPLRVPGAPPSLQSVTTAH